MIWLLICLVIKTLNPIVTELFIRGRNLNISLLFIMQTYFDVPKNVRLNSTHYFILKLPKKKRTPYNQLLDIDFKDFMNLYKKFTA